MMKRNLWVMPALAALATTAYAVTTRSSETTATAAQPDSFQPLAESAARAKDTEPKGIAWEPTFEAALTKAKAQNKLVMVDFHAEWCGACRTLDKKTFTDANVVAASRRFVNVKVDVDKQQEIAARYGVSSLPTIGWLKGDGKPVGGIVGAYPPKEFIAAQKVAQQRADKAKS